MSIKLLTVPEPLLKTGHYVGMIGEWGEKFDKKWYRVNFARQLVRDWRIGYMPAAATAVYNVDPDATIHLEPRYYTTLYQARIGITPDWFLYIRWPTNEYRMILEHPAYAPVPTETTDRKYIGFVDWRQSPFSDDPEDLRFEMFFVRDWMPTFDCMPNTILDYVKMVARFLINQVTIHPVTDEKVRAKLENMELPYKEVLHYSEYVKRTAGL